MDNAGEKIVGRNRRYTTQRGVRSDDRSLGESFQIRRVSLIPIPPSSRAHPYQAPDYRDPGNVHPDIYNSRERNASSDQTHRLLITTPGDLSDDNASVIFVGVKSTETSTSTVADIANRSSSRPGIPNRCRSQQPQKDYGGRTRARAESPLYYRPSTSGAFKSSSSREFSGKRVRFSTPLRSPDLSIQAEETRRKSPTGNVTRNVVRPTLHASRMTSVLGTETREEEVIEKRQPHQVQFQVPNTSDSMGKLIKKVTSVFGDHICGRYRKNFKGKPHQQEFSDALNKAILGIRSDCSSLRAILALFEAIDPLNFNAEIERAWRILIKKDAI